MAKAKSWAKLAPKTKKARRALHAKCGDRAFLDPVRLKFPIMGRRGTCRIDCRGVKAAFKRARQHHHAKVAQIAQRMAASWHC